MSVSQHELSMGRFKARLMCLPKFSTIPNHAKSMRKRERLQCLSHDEGGLLTDEHNTKEKRKRTSQQMSVEDTGTIV